MENGLNKKFDIAERVVGLFDTKFSATVFTFLVCLVVYLLMDNRDLNKDKDKLNEMVIQEVRKQVAPIKASTESARVSAQKTSTKIDTMLNKVGETLDNVNKKIK